ncbi:MAG: DEAD/DEAH box helicase [Cyclobacteriaceae bacterium]
MSKSFNFNFSPRTKPFTHQVEAINYVEKKDEVALFDEQGLGKTKIVIESICNNISSGHINGALIICKKNLIHNWQEEIETHSFLKSIVLRGTARERGIKFMGFAHFYLLNYESVRKELERIKMFLKVRKLAIVLDESHAIKNPESLASQSILQLSKFAAKKIIISGTPIANKPEDLWSQFFFLDNGKLLGSSFAAFKSTYSFDPSSTETFLNKKKYSELSLLIGNNSIRRKKNDVLELPEKKFIDKYVELTGLQKQMYHDLNRDLYLEVQNMDGENVIDESSEILKKLLRLIQISSNPKLIDNSYNEVPAKFHAIDEILNKIINEGEKVIIWSSFVGNIKALSKLYGKFGTRTIFGELSIDQRNKNLDRFKKDRDCRILIANPAAAREGLTLTVANNAIYLDRNFNLVDYLQSQDRIHRISQTKECNIFKLITRDSIDIYVDEILSRKHYLADFVQGTSKSINFTETLTRSDLLRYLNPYSHGQ